MSTVSQRQGRKHSSPPEKLIIDKKWQESSRDELLDQLILLSTAWDQSTLVERFFRPYKDSPAAYLFLEDGVEVAIPQCPKLIYRIYTIYQAAETLYNVCMEDTTELTAELVQLHLVQLRTICSNITPASTTPRRQPPLPHERPPLPTTVMWIEEDFGVAFVVFGVGKSGTPRDRDIMDREMARMFRTNTKVD
jgi:hypothetical protein